MCPPIKKMKICLSMIVKNESKIVRRCLASVKPVISHYIIHDTGSTDNTCEIIEDVLQGIPGHITKTQFVNFEKNRNIALKEACDVDCDFVLLIDADMELIVKSMEDFLGLTAPVYSLAQKDLQLSYHNVRMIGRAAFSGSSYKGVTHEYLSTPFGCVPLSDEIAYMRDYCDGGSKGDKFVRDQQLLEAYMADNSTCARTKFYLAQTYRDMGLITKSVDMYRQYLKLDSWDEEKFYAQYMIGSLLKSEGSDIAFHELVKAYEQRPSRAEPLAKLCEMCRDKKWNSTGVQFAILGHSIPLSKDTLFVDVTTYVYTFLYEMSIMAYYTGNMDLGRRACNALLLSSWGDGRISNVKQNLVFYLDKLPDITHQKFEYEMPSNWSSLNPSAVVHNDKLHCNIRCVNYVLKDGVYYHNEDVNSHGGDHLKCVSHFNEQNPVKTRNFRCIWSETDVVEVKQENMLPYFHTNCVGFEDMRLFIHNDEVWFTSTTRHTTAHGQNEIVVGNHQRMHRLKPLSHCEKNWCFIPGNDKNELVFLYAWHPLKFLHFKLEDKELLEHYHETVIEHNLNLHDFRGSSNAIAFENGILVAVHSVFLTHDSKRNYIHRLVYLNAEWDITHITKSFKIDPDLIDYVSSLAIHKDKLYITWGKHDCEAWLSFMPIESLKQHLFKEENMVENQLKIQ